MPEELRLSIEKLVYGGDGLAHADSNAVFTPFVLPGEIVRAQAVLKKKKLVWAKPVEIVKASAERTAPVCPHFGVCGGCHYQHATYDAQVKIKTEILRETLSRMGGIAWDGEIRTHTAEPLRYRNRAQWAVRNANPRALGYYLPESNAIVPIDRCDVLSPTLADTFARLQEIARQGSLPAEALEIEAFVDSTDSQIALNVAFKEFTHSPAEISTLLREALPALESLLLLNQRTGRFELSGPGYLIQEAGGYQFRVGHLSFFQVNRFLVEELLKTVLGAAHGELALDLYAGVGFFTLPLTKSFERVISVDSNLSATRNLRENAETADRSIVSQHVQVEEFLKTVKE